MSDLDERNLDECAGIGGGLGFGRMDWDGDGVFRGATCTPPDFHDRNAVADTNNDGLCITFGPNGLQKFARVGDLHDRDVQY
jgi:hypothetical protein